MNLFSFGMKRRLEIAEVLELGHKKLCAGALTARFRFVREVEQFTGRSITTTTEREALDYFISCEKRKGQAGLVCDYTLYVKASTLNAICCELKRAGHMDHNPFLVCLMRYSHAKPGATRATEALRWDQVLRMIDCQPDTPKGRRNKAFIGLLCGCGLRIGNVQNLLLSEIRDGGADGMKLMLTKTKSQSHRLQDVPEDVADHLRIYLQQRIREGAGLHDALFRDCARPARSKRKTMIYSSLRRWWNDCLKDAEIFGRYTPHSGRATVATHLKKEQVPIEAIADYLGHASVHTTEIYIKRALIYEDSPATKISFKTTK